MQECWSIVDYMTQADGNISFFLSYAETATNPAYARMWIYQPWLDAVGMEAPTTTEEFYEVMKAFATKDPNGNGVIRDTINKSVLMKIMFLVVDDAFRYNKVHKRTAIVWGRRTR